ncbi:MAG: hypothetical protein WD044_11270 [Dongiaceae bacterium]
MKKSFAKNLCFSCPARSMLVALVLLQGFLTQAAISSEDGAFSSAIAGVTLSSDGSAALILEDSTSGASVLTEISFITGDVRSIELPSCNLKVYSAHYIPNTKLIAVLSNSSAIESELQQTPEHTSSIRLYDSDLSAWMETIRDPQFERITSLLPSEDGESLLYVGNSYLDVATGDLIGDALRRYHLSSRKFTTLYEQKIGRIFDIGDIVGGRRLRVLFNAVVSSDRLSEMQARDIPQSMRSSSSAFLAYFDLGPRIREPQASPLNFTILQLNSHTQSTLVRTTSNGTYVRVPIENSDLGDGVWEHEIYSIGGDEISSLYRADTFVIDFDVADDESRILLHHARASLVSGKFVGVELISVLEKSNSGGWIVTEISNLLSMVSNHHSCN